jgi:hypothetical protein
LIGVKVQAKIPASTRATVRHKLDGLRGGYRTPPERCPAAGAPWRLLTEVTVGLLDPVVHPGMDPAVEDVKAAVNLQ